MIGNLKNRRHLTDDAPSSDGLGNDAEDEAEHGGAAVELLGEQSETLRDLGDVRSARILHRDDDGATRRGDISRRATSGERRVGEGWGSTGQDGSGGDECSGVHFSAD